MNNWIQRSGISKHKGVLHNTVQRMYGRNGFTKQGTIKVLVLHALARKRGITGKRARLALTLRRLR